MIACAAERNDMPWFWLGLGFGRTESSVCDSSFILWQRGGFVSFVMLNPLSCGILFYELLLWTVVCYASGTVAAAERICISRWNSLPLQYVLPNIESFLFFQ